MIYVSIDVETTGKVPETADLLSVGAIIEDTNNILPWERIPKFYAVIERTHIKGHPFAIAMNAELIAQISAYMEADEVMQQTLSGEMVKQLGAWGGYMPEMMVSVNFVQWLHRNGIRRAVVDRGANVEPVSINVAGKNFALLDKLFLDKLPGWERGIKVRHRIIDPAMEYVNWKEDKHLPSMDECNRRAGITDEVTHHALYDAWNVIRLLRKGYVS